ncbi:hypothetical protein [Pseudolactococcus paracarnosus]|uniref:Type II secretion system protein n=1 Tax=Pseudolactococcus paracarnosus TaxID=2749962 RepID=A0ABT0AL02_9LACT|nr:hypothetical protein [Lactococcus paracarnosus]MCJ1977234.1 hypothetical protein [Lactococcus paracarnosus]MCJ1983270.1 hypothetical protein [Lactococcus paracarnosus]MCJ1998080.1 hypothetical protein [Lactococcus paracarnosus]
MTYLTDESGITLTELLAVIILLTVITTLLTTAAGRVFAIRNSQETKIKCQVVANRLYTDLNTVSNESLVNVKSSSMKSDAQALGESGKYSRGGWADNQMVKLLDASVISSPIPLTYLSPGVEQLKLVRQKDSSEVNCYQTPTEQIKLKVYLVKNKHENQVLKQGEANFRDSFSIQSTVYVVFYKGTINWSNYIPEENAPMEIADVKKDMSDKIVYARVFDVTYRDDAKSAGEVAGNGKW